jgi:hypothetical protein
MMNTLTGIFIILHGLVHFWYVVLSFQWVEFQPDMGWTGRSWLLSSFMPETTLRSIAGVLFIIATIAFVISGIGIFIRADWMNHFIFGSAIFSSVVLLMFWDGEPTMLVQKGVIGLVINLVMIAIVLFKG